MKKQGIGVACMHYGIGKTGHAAPAGAFVQLLGDGTLLVAVGLSDMGQGVETVLAQIAAETAGVSVDQVTVKTGDTTIAPDAGPTSASRSTYILGNAVRKGVLEAMKPIFREASARLEVQVDDLIARNGKIFPKDKPEEAVALRDILAACQSRGEQCTAGVTHTPAFGELDPETGSGFPYPTYAFATQIVKVEVDTETGQVQVLQVVAVHDVGRAINPMGIEGQVEGGVAMGLGYALTEEIKYKDGAIVNPRLSTYILPTSLDVCQVDTIIVEDPEPSGPFGAKGVGEPALIPTAPAIAGAIFDAVGIWVTELPITPERMLNLLAAQGNKYSNKDQTMRRAKNEESV